MNPHGRGALGGIQLGLIHEKRKALKTGRESQRGESDNENAVRVKTAGESDDKKDLLSGNTARGIG